MSENDPKTFEDFKRIMENHWKEEITSPKTLKNFSALFYINHIKNYCRDCLFMELLDLQIYLSDKHENFPFIYPVYLESIVDISRDPTQIQKTLMPGNFVSDANNLIISNRARNNLRNFLQENPIFDYYFWNVTFPNICLGFIFDEYCNNAVTFLNYFIEDLGMFSKGVTSFIVHNYYFRDSFMKSYFIEAQNQNNSIEYNLQKSLIKSMQKLTIQQFDMLEILFKKYTEEFPQIFLKNIIIHMIKLWKYSPLFQIGNQIDLVDYLTNQFITGENHDEKLQKFLEPVYEIIKNKITTNKIEISRIVFNENHEFVYTFLDILIIEKANNNYIYRAQIGPLLDNLNEAFIFKKAFYYSIFHKTEGCPHDMEVEMNVKMPPLDVDYTKKWQDYCDDCKKKDKNPVEVFYNEKTLSNLLKQDPNLAFTGIVTSYYKWLDYSKTKKVLKTESRAFVQLKDIIESQKNLIEIYSLHYCSVYPIPHENLVGDLMNLFKKEMKNFMMKFIKYKFRSSNRFKNTNKLLEKLDKEKKKKKINQKSINEINKDIEKFHSEKSAEFNKLVTKYEQEINNEFSQKTDFYFNNENSSENLYGLLDGIAIRMLKILEPKSIYNFEGIKPVFDLYIERMEMLTKHYFIKSFYDVKVKIVNPTSTIVFANYNEIKNESFLIYAASGIFNYISNFVDSLKNDDFESNESIPIGKVFVATPVIKKFIEKFIAIKDTLPFLVENQTISEKELIMMILEYAFKFYSNGKLEGVVEEEVVKKKTNHFIQFLDTALNMIDSFVGRLSYSEKMNDDFLFLKKYITI